MGAFCTSLECDGSLKSEEGRQNKKQVEQDLFSGHVYHFPNYTQQNTNLWEIRCKKAVLHKNKKKKDNLH